MPDNIATSAMTAESHPNAGVNQQKLSTDWPIERPDEDALERVQSAEAFAKNVLALDFSRGLVVGVLGPWGSGKTSYINLARTTFGKAGARVIDFNPWLFSGVDRLVDAFFAELSSELRLLPELQEAGKRLEEYGELLSGVGWVPLIGPWAERMRLAVRLAARGLKTAKGGTSVRRKKVERALGKLTSPIVVVLDDIDRLTTAEIRQVFQLVRLTASFPSVVYVLAFDRHRVEQALTEEGVPGRAYLEKILQVAIDLPVAPAEVLQSQIFRALNSALSTIPEPGDLDPNVWPDLFFDIIRPLVNNMRDVNRYALAVRTTVASLNAQIALADVLALEAVRVFIPDVFALLPVSIPALTNVDEGPAGRVESPGHKAIIDEMLRVAGSQGAIARAVLTRLFPASRKYIDNYHFGYDWQARWLRERRVAHESLLRLYLEHVPSPVLQAHVAAEEAFAALKDRSRLDGFLRSLDPHRLEDVVAALEVFEADFQADQVVPGVVTLLNLVPDIPARPRGMFDLGPELKVTRVTFRLLRSLKDQTDLERAVGEILPELRFLSLRWEVISDVGYREKVGHRLIREEAAAELESQWRDQVRRATPDELEREPDLLHVFVAARENVPEGEATVSVPDSPRITRQLLLSARSEILSQSLGSAAVRRQPRLAWDALVRVIGDESELEARIDTLLASGETMDGAFEELVRRYTGGWRPSRT